MSDLPAPLVPANADLRGLDGFMLNVQRLFSSELYALSTGDEFKAAVSLWGRAWLQSPPGSLPNDERLLAAFSGAGKGWKKVREVALRGFVECSDGRLYHKVLCEDVLNAIRKRDAFRDRTAAATEARRKRNDERNDDRNVDRNVNASDRETDGFIVSTAAQQIDSATQHANASIGLKPDKDRHNSENDDRNVDRDDPPTLNVTSVQGQGQGQKEEKVPFPKEGNGRQAPSGPPRPDPDADLFRRGREVLGEKSGGQIAKLKAAMDGSIPKARAAIETASVKDQPAQYIAAVISKKSTDPPVLYDKGL